MKLYIIVIMCVMVIAAAIVGFIWYSKKQSDEETLRRATVESDDAMAYVEGLMTKEPDNYDKVIDELKKAEPKMELFQAKKSKIQSYTTEWIGKKDAAGTKKSNTELIVGLENEVQDPAKLAGVKLKLDSAKRAANSLGKEWEARVTKIQSLLTLNTLKEGVDAAKAKEAAGQLPEALAACDEAVKKFTKQFVTSLEK